ncbi:MAG: stage II sporulation protein P [bacterium]
MAATLDHLRRKIRKTWNRRRLSREYGRLIGFYGIVLVALFLIGLRLPGSRPAEEAVPAFSSDLSLSLPRASGAAEPFFRRWFAADVDVPRFLLQSEIPLLALMSHADEDLEQMSFRQIVIDGAVYQLTGINIAKPVTFLASQIPLLAGVDANVAGNWRPAGSARVITPDNISRAGQAGGTDGAAPAGKPVRAALPPSDKPDVIIYHTHTTESFQPSSGQDFTTDLNLTVAAVGEEMARTLKAMNVGVVHDKTVHDVPGRIGAYQRAESTIAALVRQYQDAAIVIDLHRDALPKETVTVTMNGQTYARISLQVGTDKIYSHPKWRENYEFARQLADEIDKLYPELLRGVPLREDRFNQHYHPQALLLEIGSNESTQQEAERTARLIAGVLAKFIKP